MLNYTIVLFLFLTGCTVINQTIPPHEEGVYNFAYNIQSNKEYCYSCDIVECDTNQISNGVYIQ